MKKELLKKHIWDLLLALVMFAAGGYFIFRVVEFNVLPSKWLIVLILILVLLALLMTLLIFAKIPKWSQWIRRVFIVILCGLLGYGSIYVSKASSAVKQITTPDTISKIGISVVVKADSEMSKVSDLKKAKVGIQNGNDKENGTFVKKKLKAAKVSDITYVEGLDYTSLMNQLMNNEIDALIIANASYGLLKREVAGVEGGTKILKTWQRERPVEVSTSDKDIRYDTFTIYLTGIDDVGSPDQNTRSDVNMLLIVNPLANHIELISIPRDTFVPNPALGNVSDKLTHTGNDGPENTVKAFEKVLGIDIDYYLKLSFTSVIEIIDTIGEIEVDVPLDFCEQDENRSFAQEDLICLNKGTQKLNGKQALALARHRHSYTDRDRTHAQQAIIKGIVNKLVSASGIAKVDKVLEIAPKYIMTNMPMSQVTSFISYQLDHLGKWTVSSTYIDNGADAMLSTASMGGNLALSVYLLNKDDIQAVLDKYAEMSSQMKFSEFTFDLNNLNKDRLTVPTNNKVVWSTSNTSAYEVYNEPETPAVPETPETPTVPETPDKETPDKETPETPDKETPSDGSNNGSSEKPDSGTSGGDTPSGGDSGSSGDGGSDTSGGNNSNNNTNNNNTNTNNNPNTNTNTQGQTGK